jgi:hypothetical protein
MLAVSMLVRRFIYFKITELELVLGCEDKACLEGLLSNIACQSILTE